MKGILIDNDGDLMIRPKRDAKGVIISGLVVGDCRADIAERIIRAWQGEFKEAPLLGGNIEKMQHGIIDPFWRGNIRKQLDSEGISVKRLDITENGIELELK